MPTSDYYLQYVEALDEGDFAVSDWEADFLESLLARRPSYLSEKQQETIRRMAQKYLGEDLK